MSGDSSSVQEQLFDVSEVFASEDAFAALKRNGTVSSRQNLLVGERYDGR